MEIVQSILTGNDCYKVRLKNQLKGLMLHSVGCPQPCAKVFIQQWNRPGVKKAVHAFIDGKTGTVYQTLPWEHRGWHCGTFRDAQNKLHTANSTHIGVEMCEPECIDYISGASFLCYDRNKALEVVNRTYNSAVELFASLCRKYDLDPLADGVIISHNEGHARGIASGHKDPEHLWEGLQSGHTMDGFRHDVKNALDRMTSASV